MPEDVMIITVETYNTILRDKLKGLSGYEVKSEGEVFMAAFPSAVAAVKWSSIVQEALLVADWPDRLLSNDKCAQRTSSDGRLLFRGVSVRMGMHNGNPELKPSPITGRADYYGPCVNKSARVSGISQGGQVLISESVYSQIIKDTDLMKNSSANSIGKFTLRGFQEEEQIYQILPKTLSNRVFGSSSEPAVSIQDIASTRKRVMKVKSEPPKAGIVQEVPLRV
jgi:class 3 adenylate cyclase